ncbi:MAG TPA: hypothetical protein VGL08_15670 [Paraburkholderia sp.]
MLSTACTFLPQPSHYVTATTPDYDATVAARVRILSGNDSQTASYEKDSVCYRNVLDGNPNTVRVDDGFFAAYKYSSHSITIGMPPSPRPWMRTDGLRFKDMIKEYVVDGGKPMTISMSVSNSVGDNRTGGWSTSCTPPSVTFTPTAGHDYDVFMDGDGRRCWISARQIDEKGLDELVRLERAPKCAADAIRATSVPSTH